MKQLGTFPARSARPVLVLHDAASAGVVADLGPDCEVHATAGRVPREPTVGRASRWSSPNRGALRRAADHLPRLGRTRAVACLLTDDDRPAHVGPRPDWPPVTRLSSRTLPSGGALTVLHLQGPMPAHLVLRELARVAGTSRPAPGRILLEPSTRTARRFTLPPEIVVVADDSVPVEEYDASVAAAAGGGDRHGPGPRTDRRGSHQPDRLPLRARPGRSRSWTGRRR